MTSLPRLPRSMTSRFAAFSACGKYRYWLRRELGGNHDGEVSGNVGRVLWIMMNPSRADAARNDATTTLVTNISRRHGFAHHGQVNLSALIEPDSTKLNAHAGGQDTLNWCAIRAGLRWADQAADNSSIVIAWGACRHLKPVEARVLRLLRGRRLFCLGQNADGSPRFPRGIRRDVVFQTYIPSA